MSGSEIIETPVLIVGGAGCGLASAIFLSDLGIESWLVERHPHTSPAPKAHYINTRVMEMFREVGLADDIYRLGAPTENMSRVGWYTSLGGDGPLARKRLGIMDAFGGCSLRERYEAATPCMPSNYPQLRLEPLLYDWVKRQDVAKLNYYHELVSFMQDEDGVTAVIERREDGSQYTVRAKYMIAADGGKKVAGDLGIEMDGIPRLVDMASAHFKADLSPYIDDDSVMIRWFNNPEQGGGTWGSGVIVAMGPEKYDRHSKEWLIHFGFHPDDPAQFDHDTMADKIRNLFGLPDLDIEIVKMNNWHVQGVLARNFRIGRVFLAGDAAHRHPPTTGLGLNSAIQDAHNLAWKLAAVLKEQASDAMLDSYEDERRQVTGQNVEWALMAFQNYMTLDSAVGVIPGAPVEVNKRAYELMFSDTEIGRARRARFEEVLQTQRLEFQALVKEVGYAYENSVAVIPDGTAPPVEGALGDEYVAIARPGHRFPHFWIEADGLKSSTIDLFGHGHFVLLAGADRDAWIEACAIMSEKLGVPVDAWIFGGNAIDLDGKWSELSGVSAGGAVLVRPDGHVGWRSVDAVSDPKSALQTAMRTILQTA